VGVEQGIGGARSRLRHLLAKYELCEQHQKEIISEIEAYLNCIDYTPFLLSLEHKNIKTTLNLRMPLMQRQFEL